MDIATVEKGKKMSRWYARYKNCQGEYEITFASKDYEKTKAVEKVCQMIIDDVVKSRDDIAAVVRCEDCMYWQSGENEAEKWEYCNFHNIDIGPHAFCSYGERKEGTD